MDTIYNAFKAQALQDFIDGDILNAVLLTSAYTPDKDAHSTYADLTGEVTGDGYTQGGQALSNVSVTQDNTNDQAVLDADDVEWTNSTIAGAKYVAVYRVSDGALVAVYLLRNADGEPEEQTSENGSLAVQLNETGVVALS